MVEIYAGVSERRLPIPVEHPAPGRSDSVLRHLGHSRATSNVWARADTGEPANPGARAPGQRAHLAAAR